MNDIIRSKLADFREWARTRNFSGVRLVKYCGVEKVGAIDIADIEVEAQIEGLLCEAFYVDWAEWDGKLYLRVWEDGEWEPPWSKVFAEEHLVDMDEWLREMRDAV